MKDAAGNTVDDSANKAALGASVHDTATLTGQSGYSVDSGPTVTYSFFNNSTCATAAAISTLSLHDALPILPDSSVSGALAAGDYSYQATYNGNANYTTKTGS